YALPIPGTGSKPTLQRGFRLSQLAESRHEPYAGTAGTVALYGTSTCTEKQARPSACLPCLPLTGTTLCMRASSSQSRFYLSRRNTAYFLAAVVLQAS